MLRTGSKPISSVTHGMGQTRHLHALRERTRDRCCTKATLPLTLQPTWLDVLFIVLYKQGLGRFL